MPLKAVKKGSNMYQDWITETHTHLGGECPHGCSYCYVETGRFGRHPRYQGEPRLIWFEMNVDYGEGRTIFIEHMQDLFAEGIPGAMTEQVLEHCNRYPHNVYVFQSKNPERAYKYFKQGQFPKKCMMGTTIESNRHIKEHMGNAPHPEERYKWIKKFMEDNVSTFITIEPIMIFDVGVFSGWIIDAKPSFVNIGADSKGCKLPEPPGSKITALVEALGKGKIEIKKKSNLRRIWK